MDLRFTGVLKHPNLLRTATSIYVWRMFLATLSHLLFSPGVRDVQCGLCRTKVLLQVGICATEAQQLRQQIVRLSWDFNVPLKDRRTVTLYLAVPVKNHRNTSQGGKGCYKNALDERKMAFPVSWNTLSKNDRNSILSCLRPFVGRHSQLPCAQHPHHFQSTGQNCIMLILKQQ